MRIFGLIGYPLPHSFSKKYFTEKFERERLKDIVYQLFEVKDIERGLKYVLEENPTLCGLNITIPHKQNIIPLLNELDESAKAVGAVNCIRIESRTKNQEPRTKLIGYNTDVYGFEVSLKKHLKSHHKNALILGTGGASKAAEYVLKKNEIKYQLVSRGLSPTLSKGEGADLTYKKISKEILINHTLIINASPVGMYPNISAAPEIPYEYLNKNHLLFDMVYNPEETLFMKKGKQQGATVVNGLEMLHLQAEKAWEIWNE